MSVEPFHWLSPQHRAAALREQQQFLTAARRAGRTRLHELQRDPEQAARVLEAAARNRQRWLEADASFIR